MGTGLTLARVDSHDPTPKYLQAQRIVLDAIRSGELPPGAKLPSTRDIGALIKVSLITAHKALDALVASGWLRREIGRGTFVRQDINLAAAAERHLSIAIVLDHCCNINDHYHSAILEGLRREARADGHRTDFFFQERLTLQAAGRHGSVGAICIHPRLECQTEVEHLARHYPVLVVGGAFPESDVACVDCDNHAGGREAVRHLLELGHRRFLLLSGPTNLSNARDRTEGAVAELAEHGIGLRDGDLLVSEDSVVLDERARGRLQARMADADHPTAIFAGGFYLALAVMQIVRGAGWSMPGDVSIVGFDDPASAALLDPPLTTVRQPLEEMAARAFRSIRQAIVGEKRSMASCKLPTELVVRASTGPCRASEK
jgi:GntR family transcriptional regulator, arabinose operon transcriptional repressor